MMSLFLILLIASAAAIPADAELCAHEVIITRVSTRPGYGLGLIFNPAVKLQVTETLFAADGRVRDTLTYDIEQDKSTVEDKAFADYNKKLHKNTTMDISVRGDAKRVVDFGQNKSAALLPAKAANERSLHISASSNSARYLDKGYSCEPLSAHISFASANDPYLLWILKTEEFRVVLTDSYKWNMLKSTETAREYSAAELRQLNDAYEFGQFALPK